MSYTSICLKAYLSCARNMSHILFKNELHNSPELSRQIPAKTISMESYKEWAEGKMYADLATT